MGGKTGNVLKRYLLPTCLMCVITLLIFLYLAEMESLALGFLLMAVLLFIINVSFRLLVSKGIKGTSKICKTIKGFLFLFILLVNLTIAFSATILLFSNEMFFIRIMIENPMKKIRSLLIMKKSILIKIIKSSRAGY